jgi:acetyltransferase
MEIELVTKADTTSLAQLSELLRDSVEGGASVGFLAPFEPNVADNYWQQTLASVGPELVLWVARIGGRVVGSVQLALSSKANGRHRGEVQKLLVLGSCRRQGIARQLMSTLEAYARGAGRTMLVLDTQKGSAAESLYLQLGWAKAGEIPDFAEAPYGGLEPTALYFKRLTA